MLSKPSAEAPKSDKNTDEDDDIQDPKLTEHVGMTKGTKHIVIDVIRHSTGISFPGNVTAFKIAKELVLRGLNIIKDIYHHLTSVLG